MASKREAATPPVDRGNDNRTGWSHSAGPARSTEELVTSGPRLGAADPFSPEDGSAEEDEHRGLAKRILDLRRFVEAGRIAGVKETADLRQIVAQLEQTVTTATRAVDTMMKEWVRRGSALDATQREAGEQVRAAGEQVRRVKDELKALEELRESAADPHDVVRPLRKDIGQLQHDLLLLTQQVDRRFELLPKAKPQPWEMRGDDEDPFMVLGRQLQALKQRVEAIESSTE